MSTADEKVYKIRLALAAYNEELDHYDTPEDKELIEEVLSYVGALAYNTYALLDCITMIVDEEGT